MFERGKRSRGKRKRPRLKPRAWGTRPNRNAPAEVDVWFYRNLECASEERVCAIQFRQCPLANLRTLCSGVFFFSSDWLPVPSPPCAVGRERASLCGWGYGACCVPRDCWPNRRLSWGVLPHWLQVCVPAFLTVAVYLVLPVAVLTWLELSVGRVRLFLRAVILIALLIGIAAIGLFALTGSRSELLRYSDDLLAVIALIVQSVALRVTRPPAIHRCCTGATVGWSAVKAMVYYLAYSRIPTTPFATYPSGQGTASCCIPME
jgi:hypothetical protein